MRLTKKNQNRSLLKPTKPNKYGMYQVSKKTYERFGANSSQICDLLPNAWHNPSKLALWKLFTPVIEILQVSKPRGFVLHPQMRLITNR
jgi:hypothetical protein